jgi:hypothetical protein
MTSERDDRKMADVERFHGRRRRSKARRLKASAFRSDQHVDPRALARRQRRSRGLLLFGSDLIAILVSLERGALLTGRLLRR